VWMEALSSWRSASLYGNNVRIIGYTWLPYLSTYPLGVIRPWWVIMGPMKYSTTILMSRKSENLPHISLLEPGISDCRLPCVFSNVNSSWCREQRSGRLFHPYHVCFSSCVMSRFYGHDTIIYASDPYFQY
jgi:hypothetical protein